MALRDWTPRRLVLLWTIGLALEAALIASVIIQNQRQSAEADARWNATFGPGSDKRRLTGAERDSVLKVLADSFGVTLHTHGDTLSGLELSPAAQAKAARAMDALAPTLFAMAAVAVTLYGAIPLGLAALTLLWYRTRRREARTEHPAPAT